MVECNKCKKTFTPMLKEQEKQMDGQQVIRTFFCCPHCEEQYLVCFDTSATLVLKKQIRRKTEELKTARGKRHEQLLKEIQRKQRRLSKEMNVLKSKYKEHF